MGFFVQQWPTCLGMDVAGVCEEVDEDVQQFKKGERVAGRLIGVLSPDFRNGAYQKFSIVPAVTSAKIPDSVSFTEASVLPVAFDTTLVALCSPPAEGLNLLLPTLQDEQRASDDTLVIWGGSSSVGSMAIQLAKAADVRVIASAGSHNFDFCKQCGADDVLDYKIETVVNDVIEAVKARAKFAGIFDCVSLPKQSFEPCQAVLKAFGEEAIHKACKPEKVNSAKVRKV